MQREVLCLSGFSGMKLCVGVALHQLSAQNLTNIKKQNKTKQNKTKQNKTKQHKSKHSLTENSLLPGSEAMVLQKTERPNECGDPPCSYSYTSPDMQELGKHHGRPPCLPAASSLLPSPGSCCFPSTQEAEH